MYLTYYLSCSLASCSEGDPEASDEIDEGNPTPHHEDSANTGLDLLVDVNEFKIDYIYENPIIAPFAKPQGLKVSLNPKIEILGHPFAV